MPVITDVFLTTAGPTAGGVASAYSSSRFTGIPAVNQAPPSGSPDAGPATTDAMGTFQLTAAPGSYWVLVSYQGVNTWQFYNVLSGAATQVDAGSFTVPPITQGLLAGTGEGAITSPLGTISVGGTATAPTLDVASITHARISDWTTATAGFAGSSSFNVKTYGAKGDGVTVDTTAVQAAITAALAAGGGIVVFPPGTYVVSNITFGNNLTVVGAGMGATILLADPGQVSVSFVVCRVAPASSSVTTSWCSVRDLTIDGNKAFWGINSNQKVYGYYMGQATAGLITNCSMSNVEIRNCLSYAFDVENVQYVNLTNCWAHDNGYTTGTGTNHACDGFTLIGNDITCVNCRSISNSARGYQAGQNGVNWSRIKLIGCSAEANNIHGVLMGSSSGFFVYDCAIVGGSFINSVTGCGISLSTGTQRCAVSGNDCSGNFQQGILVSAASYNTIMGNTVTNNSSQSATDNELYLTSSSTYNVVTGNMVNSTNANHAIAEQNSSTDFNVITSNEVTSLSTTITPAGLHTVIANNQGYSSTAAVAATVASNATTLTANNPIWNVTNSSAATLTVTLAVTGPTPDDGQQMTVRVYDFSAAAETITWVNTENGEGTAPTTSNGSTTLPVTVVFRFNAATTKWRCIIT